MTIPLTALGTLVVLYAGICLTERFGWFAREPQQAVEPAG
jgi:hypothetical protein